MGERTVLLKTASVFLVIAVGYAIRRRGHLPAETTASLSRFAVDVAFPALVFVQMIRTVDGAALRDGWYLPAICAGVLLAGWGVGLALAPLFAAGKQRSTFAFLVTFANFVFLPLPIAQALFGDAGVRAILLFNVGGQLVFWSFGIWMLSGGLSARETARQVLTNRGLIATAAGVLTALFVPAAHTWEGVAPTAPPLQLAAGAVVQALAMLGGLTIPLTLLVIGAQLGGLAVKLHRPSRALAGVLLARLVVAPAVVMALVAAAAHAGLRLPEVARTCTYLIAAMSVGFSCSVFAERFGGDAELSAQAIFTSTFFSLITAPAVLAIAGRLGV